MDEDGAAGISRARDDGRRWHSLPHDRHYRGQPSDRLGHEDHRKSQLALSLSLSLPDTHHL